MRLCANCVSLSRQMKNPVICISKDDVIGLLSFAAYNFHVTIKMLEYLTQAQIDKVRTVSKLVLLFC